jgi:uncharacterized protein
MEVRRYDRLKRCPFCAEEILAAATKCKHCKSDLIEQPKPKSSKAATLVRTPFKVMAALVVLAIVWTFIYAIMHPESGSETAAKPPKIPSHVSAPSPATEPLPAASAPRSTDSRRGTAQRVTHTHNIAGGPSFDCEKARSRAEHMICADPELSDLDASLARTYKQAREIAPDKAAFDRDNQNELQRREATCFDNACLFEWYFNRGNRLAKLILSRPYAADRGQSCRPLYDETSDGEFERFQKIVARFTNRHGETEQQFYGRVGSSPTKVAAFAIASEHCGSSIVEALQSLDGVQHVLSGESPIR